MHETSSPTFQSKEGHNVNWWVVHHGRCSARGQCLYGIGCSLALGWVFEGLCYSDKEFRIYSAAWDLSDMFDLESYLNLFILQSSFMLSPFFVFFPVISSGVLNLFIHKHPVYWAPPYPHLWGFVLKDCLLHCSNGNQLIFLFYWSEACNSGTRYFCRGWTWI